MAAARRGADGIERVPDSAPPAQLAVLPKASISAITFITRASNGIPALRLYFLRDGDWIVTIRASLRDTDKASIAAADAFVRALPWASLGTADGSH
jgi:hypothetical protein